MQVYGLVGNPVGHSLSPPMHEAAYEETGLDARYVTFEPARDDIAAAVGGGTLGVVGLNVTIPFKQDVLDAVDPDRSPSASARSTPSISPVGRRRATTPTRSVRSERWTTTTCRCRVRRSSLGPAVRGERSRSVSPTRGVGADREPDRV